MKELQKSEVKKFFYLDKQNNMKIEVIPIFHPAYLLRNPIEKKHVWEDLKKIYMIIKKNKICYKMVKNKDKFINLNISIFVVSDTRNERSDKSGKILETHIINSGHKVFEKKSLLQMIKN